MLVSRWLVFRPGDNCYHCNPGCLDKSRISFLWARVILLPQCFGVHGASAICDSWGLGLVSAAILLSEAGAFCWTAGAPAFWLPIYIITRLLAHLLAYPLIRLSDCLSTRLPIGLLNCLTACLFVCLVGCRFGRLVCYLGRLGITAIRRSCHPGASAESGLIWPWFGFPEVPWLASRLAGFQYKRTSKKQGVSMPRREKCCCNRTAPRYCERNGQFRGALD